VTVVLHEMDQFRHGLVAVVHDTPASEGVRPVDEEDSSGREAEEFPRLRSSARLHSRNLALRTIPSAAHSSHNSRAPTVFGVPGSPVSTRCRGISVLEPSPSA